MATIVRKRAVAPVDGAWQMPVNQMSDSVELARQELFDEPEQTDTDRVIELMRSASGAANASVKVYKQDNGVSTFCESYSPNEFQSGDYTMLRDSFGAGKYKIMLYGEHPETGKFGLLAREMVSIAESRTPKQITHAPQNDGMNAGMMQMFEMIARGQQQTNELLLSMKSAPQKDSMEEMQKMLLMMSSMRAAMGIDNQPKQSGISDVIAAIREMRGVASEILPERAEKEDSLVSMLPGVLDLIKTGMQNQPQQIATPQMQQIATPAIFQQTETTTESQNVRISEILKLKSSLNKIVKMAVDGVSTTTAAQYVYEELPDEFIDVMAQDNWFDLLALVEPGIKPHQAWMAQTRGEALAQFDAPDESESPTTTEPTKPA